MVSPPGGYFTTFSAPQQVTTTVFVMFMNYLTIILSMFVIML